MVDDYWQRQQREQEQRSPTGGGLLRQCEESGTTPSVLALARLFAMSNTTFRRRFPEIAQRVSDARRGPPADAAGRGGAARYDALVAREAKLRRANRDLTDYLKIAAANIQRLTVENHQLRESFKLPQRLTRIDRVSGKTPRK